MSSRLASMSEVDFFSSHSSCCFYKELARALVCPRLLNYAPRSHPCESELWTRKQRIDARLKRLGWSIVPFPDTLDLKVLDKIAIEELPTASGLTDYGLFVDGNLLGIIEAKKVTVNPQNVL
jgi:hypothetical protein